MFSVFLCSKPDRFASNFCKSASQPWYVMFIVDSLTRLGLLDGLSALQKGPQLDNLLSNPRTDERIGRVKATIKLGQLTIVN